MTPVISPAATDSLKATKSARPSRPTASRQAVLSGVSTEAARSSQLTTPTPRAPAEAHQQALAQKVADELVPTRPDSHGLPRAAYSATGSSSAKFSQRTPLRLRP